MHLITARALQEAQASRHIDDVLLRGVADGFVVQARGEADMKEWRTLGEGGQPMVFPTPAKAFACLKTLGLIAGRFDLSSTPRTDEVDLLSSQTSWLAAELEAAMADPADSRSHEEVMGDLAKAVGARATGMTR